MVAGITISKVKLCGISAVNREICVELDKYTNLIDGPAIDVKLSIPLAIDLILNRTYEDRDLALATLSADVSKDNNSAFVTLHISSDEKFHLNGKKSNKFKVTRFIRNNSVDCVYVDRDSDHPAHKKRQTIRSFHAELGPIEFQRIDDPIISQRTRPTVSDLNQFSIHSLNTKDQLRDIECMKTQYKLKTDTIRTIADILQMENQQMNVAKEHLVELRSLEAIILERNIANLHEKYPNSVVVDENGRRAFNMHVLADEFETIQRKRFASYKQSLEKGLAIQFDPIDLSKLKALVAAFEEKMDKYLENKTAADQIEANNKEHNRMVQMQAGLHRYVGKTEKIEQAHANCGLLIEAAKHRSLSLSGDTEQKFENLNKKVSGELKKQMNQQIETMKQIGQDLLNGQVKKLEIARELLQCTNKLSAKQLDIEQFCKDQTIMNPIQIDSWRAGLMALTLPAAYHKKVHEHFIGNLFDFISTAANDFTLDIVLPMLFPYFTMFIFKSTAAAKAFETLVKPLLKDGNQVYAYALNEVDTQQDLPFQSLAGFLLDNNTRQEYPLIENWFLQYRVANASSDVGMVKQTAKQHQCNVIYNEKCYHHENGSTTGMFNGKPGSMKNFLLQWQQLMIARNKKIKRQIEKFDLEEKKKTLTKSMDSLAKERNTAEVTITQSLFKIEHAMKDLVRISNSLGTIRSEKLNQKLDIHINEEKQKILKSGNLQPNIELKQRFVVSSADVIPVMTVIHEYQKCASKIVQAIADNNLPLADEIALNYKQNIQTLQDGLSGLQAFDYKQRFNVPNAPDFDYHNYTRICVRNALGAGKKVLMDKLTSIQKYPQLMDPNIKMRYEHSSLSELQRFKERALAKVPDGLLLPDLYADMNFFLDCSKHLDNFIGLLTDLKQNGSEKSYDLVSWSIYFNLALDVLTELNRMNREVHETGESVSIGMELSTGSYTTHIFPDTTFNPSMFQHFPMETLCDFGTGLGFVAKSNQSEAIIKSDTLDVKSHHFSRIVQSILSIKLNPSLLILNNTIVGLPIDDLRKIVVCFQLDGYDAPLNRSRQLIVVTRPSNAYPGLFAHSFKRIWCTKPGQYQFKIDCCQITPPNV